MRNQKENLCYKKSFWKKGDKFIIEMPIEEGYRIL